MILNVRERLGALSVARVRKRLAALATALLLGAVSFGATAPPASAHTATKTVTHYRTECTTSVQYVRVVTERSTAGRGNSVTYTYKPEVVETCTRVPFTASVPRSHLHISKNVCRTVVGAPVIAAASTGGAIVGTGTGGPGVGTVVGAAVGASVGTAATYTVCRAGPSDRLARLGGDVSDFAMKARLIARVNRTLFVAVALAVALNMVLLNVAPSRFLLTYSAVGTAAMVVLLVRRCRRGARTSSTPTA